MWERFARQESAKRATVISIIIGDQAIITEMYEFRDSNMSISCEKVEVNIRRVECV